MDYKDRSKEHLDSHILSEWALELFRAIRERSKK